MRRPDFLFPYPSLGGIPYPVEDQFDSKLVPTEKHRQTRRTDCSRCIKKSSRLVSQKNWKQEIINILNKKLLVVFRANKSEAAALFGQIKKTADRISFTRNYFTHYTSKSNSCHFLQLEDMIRVNHAAELFLWILLLKELGIGGRAMQLLIGRADSAIFVNMKGVVKSSKSNRAPRKRASSNPPAN